MRTTKSARKTAWMPVVKSMVRLFGILALAVLVVACGDDDPNPVTGALQPTINGMTPAQVFLGAANVDGRIFGTNLSGAVSANLGDGIQVISVQSLNSNEVQVKFTVQRTAAPGARTIAVTTSAGTATLGGVLQIANNAVPVATFKISGGEKHKNSIVTFDATGSRDALRPADAGDIASYLWDFGDGKSDRGSVVEHKYLRGGTFTVTLTVADNQGGRSQASKSLTIEDNFVPTAKFAVSGDATEGKSVTFDGSSSVDKDGKVVEFAWKLGDGTRKEGKTITHTYADAKTYTVELTVTDNDGAVDVVAKEVTVKEGSTGGGGGGGGSEGTCALNDFRTNRAVVTGVQGNVVTMNRAFRKCPGCGEFRRRASGIREFVGDIVRFDGNRYTMNYGRLPASTRPRAGETLYLVWKPSNECR